MRLTTYTDYALRVLIYVGVHHDRLVQRADIAEAYGISLHHLGKVVNHLAQQGLIHAKRGRGGGLELAHEPSAIRVGDVVRAFETDFELVECFAPETNTCPIAPVCGLGPILSEAGAAFQAVLDEYTLADILNVRGKSRYRKLLSGD